MRKLCLAITALVLFASTSFAQQGEKKEKKKETKALTNQHVKKADKKAGSSTPAGK